MNDRFGLNLILGEESSGAAGYGVDGESEADEYVSDTPRTAQQSIVIERKDFDASAPFVIGDDQRSFPLYGAGCVESLLLITEEDHYSVSVELDTASDNAGEDWSTFIDDEDYSDLRELSTELSAVAAYQNDDGQYVLDIGPVNFLDAVRAWVDTDDDMTVVRQRAEVTMQRTTQKS